MVKLSLLIILMFFCFSGDLCAKLILDKSVNNGDIIYYDDFTSDKGYNVLGASSSGKYNYGRYELSSSSSTYVGVLSQNKTIDQTKDFQIEATMKFVSGENDYGNGIIWGKSNYSWDSYYGFYFSGNGNFKVVKKNLETIISLKEWTLTSKISKTDYNKLTIRKVGNQYYFFINENLVHQCPFQTFYGDENCLIVNSNSTVHISNIAFTYFKGNTKKDEVENLISAASIYNPPIGESDFIFNEIIPGVQLVSSEEEWLKLSPNKACCCYPKFNEQNKSFGLLYNNLAYEKVKLYLLNSQTSISVCSAANWQEIFLELREDSRKINTLQLNIYPGYFDEDWYSPEDLLAGYWLDENTMVAFSGENLGEPMLDDKIYNDDDFKRQSLIALSIRVSKSSSCEIEKWHKENIDLRGDKYQIKFIYKLSDWNTYSPDYPCCSFINFDLNNASYGYLYNLKAYELLMTDKSLKDKGYRVALLNDWISLLECSKKSGGYSNLFNCDSKNYSGFNLTPNGFFDLGKWNLPENQKCNFWVSESNRPFSNYPNVIEFNCLDKQQYKFLNDNKTDIEIKNREKYSAFMIRFIKL